MTSLPSLSIVFDCNTSGAGAKVFDYGAGGIYNLTITGGFRGIVLAFGTNLLKRSLSVMGGRTRSSNILTEGIVNAFVNLLRGAYLIKRS